MAFFCRGWLAQWKNDRFVKSFVSSDRGSNLAQRQVFFMGDKINSYLRMTPRLQKMLERILQPRSESELLSNTQTSGRKGNVARLNWIYDAGHLDW